MPLGVSPGLTTYTLRLRLALPPAADVAVAAGLALLAGCSPLGSPLPPTMRKRATAKATSASGARNRTGLRPAIAGEHSGALGASRPAVQASAQAASRSRSASARAAFAGS